LLADLTRQRAELAELKERQRQRAELAELKERQRQQAEAKERQARERLTALHRERQDLAREIADMKRVVSANEQEDDALVRQMQNMQSPSQAMQSPPQDKRDWKRERRHEPRPVAGRLNFDAGLVPAAQAAEPNRTASLLPTAESMVFALQPPNKAAFGKPWDGALSTLSQMKRTLESHVLCVGAVTPEIVPLLTRPHIARLFSTMRTAATGEALTLIAELDEMAEQPTYWVHQDTWEHWQAFWAHAHDKLAPIHSCIRKQQEFLVRHQLPGQSLQSWLNGQITEGHSILRLQQARKEMDQVTTRSLLQAIVNGVHDPSAKLLCVNVLSKNENTSWESLRDEVLRTVNAYPGLYPNVNGNNGKPKPPALDAAVNAVEGEWRDGHFRGNGNGRGGRGGRRQRPERARDQRRDRSRSPRRGNRDRRRSRSRSPARKPTCSECKGRNAADQQHWPGGCPLRRNMVCSYCDKPHHEVHECYKKQRDDGKPTDGKRRKF